MTKTKSPGKNKKKSAVPAVVAIHSFMPDSWGSNQTAPCRECHLSADVPTALHYNASEKLPLRECTASNVHDPHKWHSFALDMETWCRGTGMPPYLAATTYVPKPLTHYPLPEGEERLTVPAARKIAFDMHKHQKDKDGQPYSGHLEAVRMGTVVLGGDDEVQIAALFHDAVEDDHTSFDILREAGVTERSITAIEAVTKRTSEEQGKYLERIIAGGPDAMRVKVADLLHNTRHDRLAKLPDYTRDRLLKKYRPALARLLLELDMIVDQDAQQKLATKPQGSSYGSYYSSSGSQGKKGQNFTIGSLFKGDWPSNWPAPILDKIGESKGKFTFLLANGEYRVEDAKAEKNTTRSLYTHIFTKWSVDATIKFPGVSEEEITAYRDIIEDSRVK